MSFNLAPVRDTHLQAYASAASRDSILELSEIHRIWASIWHRRRLFLIIFASFVTATAAISILTPKTFTTSAKLIVGNQNNAPNGSDPNTALPILNALLMQNGVASAETYATLIQQEGVAAQVAGNLHLKASPAAILARVNVRPIVNTAILELSVRWPNPQTSALIANEFANVFVSRERDYATLQAASAMTSLGAEIPKAGARMKAANSALATFQSQHSIVDVTSQTQALVARSTGIDAKIDAVELDRRQAQAMVASGQGQLSSLPATIVGSSAADPNPTLSQLRTQLAQVEVQLATERQRYTEAHPTVLALKNQRDELQRQIDASPASVSGATTLNSNPVVLQLRQQAAGYQAQIAGDTAQLRELRAQKTAFAPALKGLPSTATALAYLQQNSKLATQVYNALQQKFSDAQIARSTAISDVTVLQPAVAGSASVSPNVRLNVLIAILLGLIVASMTVVIADYFKRAIRSEEDVARVIGLPVIATIPEFAKPGQPALTWIRSFSAEAFLHLCTSLRLRSKKPLRKIVITSPSKGDGKSTIAVDLARSMSRLRPRVLLIDADLRRPTIHEHFATASGEGLADVLHGTHTLSQVVRSVADGLDIVTSGTRTENPVGLLQSPHLDALLVDALRTYRMVIIDAPALIPVTDAVILSAKADATALVIGATTTDERAAKIATSRLASLGITNLLGVILNRVETGFSDYSSYYSDNFVPLIPAALKPVAND